MDMVVGIGEIGAPWLKIISTVRKTVAVDIDPKKDQEKQWHGEHVDILHICLPYSKDFVDIVVSYALKFDPEMIVVHSTVKPGTTLELHNDERLPRKTKVLFSPVRGVHMRMEFDLKRYDKFYASYRSDTGLFSQLLTDMTVTGFKASTPLVLEYAKILTDTSYYAWLIAYSMITEKITMKHHLDYDEMWMFAHQIHKHLDNRPPCGAPGMNKIYPDSKGIQGHCVLPNLDLVKEEMPELYNVIHLINADCVKRHSTDG